MGCCVSTPVAEDQQQTALAGPLEANKSGVANVKGVEVWTGNQLAAKGGDSPRGSNDGRPPLFLKGGAVNGSRSSSGMDTPKIPVAPATAVPANMRPTPAAGNSTRKAGEKIRRAAAGSEAVRDQIRKLVVGGPQSKEDQARIIEVSDSDDEESANVQPSRRSQAGQLPKPPDVTAAICEALKRSFVFSGISEDLLKQTVDCMYEVQFEAGSTVLQQGALPTARDCMYFLQSGQAEVVITGAVDPNAKGNAGDQESRITEAHAVRIPQKPGWVFGDVALLFNSPRTASVVAKTDITVWAMERTTFMRLVMRHAVGARALRFVRKVPLLKGLSDNDLIRVAKRMPQRVYEDGQALIKYGERGDEMYLIRYGKVRVLVPTEQGGRLEVALLGRGQFVGERSVINDRLRSADCVAQGRCTVIVLRKRDFLDLDNPLLAWMLDYDAVSAVLKSLPAFKAMKQEQMEHILDRFDARQELYEGDEVLKQGQEIDKLFVVKMGEVQLLQNGHPVQDPTFIREAGGFTYFGECCIDRHVQSPYTVVAKSELAHVLTLPRRQLDTFLGPLAGTTDASKDALMAALRKVKALQTVRDADLATIAESAEVTSYSAGDVIAPATVSPTAPLNPESLLLVRSGEVGLLPNTVPLRGRRIQDLTQLAAASRRLLSGELCNAGSRSQDAHLIAAAAGTVVVTLNFAAVQKALGDNSGNARRRSTKDITTMSKLSSVPFNELELHRVVGTGQFGSVRVVRHPKTNEVYALKQMHKAPLVESKQIEHVVNERVILEAADHPFLVSLKGAYQDKNALYLLQEWVPGGELFHHLDVEGSFSDATACFYAANVVLALEFLHKKGIVYRDLKPENLLLDPKGYIKMADFGFAKLIGNEKTFTICGTPDYQAPEVIMRRGTSQAADYWALGVLVFEMLVGDPPFKSLTGDPWDTFRRTLSGRFYVPHYITDAAADLIYKLLQVNPEKRLGSGPTGTDEIKSHRWFSRIDWKALEARLLPAPIMPRLKSLLDTSNFDDFDDAEGDVAAQPPMVANGAAGGDKEVTWDLWDWIPDDVVASRVVGR